MANVEIFFQMAEDEYHSRPGWGSSSMWKALNQSVAHSRVKTVATRPMLIGSHFHSMVLGTPAPESHLVMESVPRRGSARWGALMEDNPGCTLVSRSVIDEARLLARVAENDAGLSSALKEATHREVSIFWDDRETGVACKARIDFLNRKTLVACDLKSTANASDSALQDSCAKYGYWTQASHYISGLKEAFEDRFDWCWYFVEKGRPGAVRRVMPDRNGLVLADAIRRKALRKIADSEVSGFDGYATGMEVTMPRWLAKMAD